MDADLLALLDAVNALLTCRKACLRAEKACYQQAWAPAAFETEAVLVHLEAQRDKARQRLCRAVRLVNERWQPVAKAFAVAPVQAIL